MAATSLAPARAIVRPMVVVDRAAPPRPFDEAVGEMLGAGRTATVWLEGPRGSGATTALQHLAAVFADEDALHLADVGEHTVPSDARVRVHAATAAPGNSEATWSLAPWTDDDCRQYLAATRPTAADAAFAAWQRPAPLGDLRSWPGLCREVLDHLAHVGDTAGELDTSDPLWSLAFVLADHLGHRRAPARARALAELLPSRRRPTHTAGSQVLWQSTTVRALLAAEELVRLAAERGEQPLPPRQWPQDVVDTIAHLVQSDATLLHRLVAQAARPPRRPALLLSVLCAAVPGFRPPVAKGSLAGARLCGADLSAMDLRGVDLRDADLRRADLAGADLRGADLRDADLQGADVRNALFDAGAMA